VGDEESTILHYNALLWQNHPILAEEAWLIASLVTWLGCAIQQLHCSGTKLQQHGVTANPLNKPS
jgi:hypothetical protein